MHMYYALGNHIHSFNEHLCLFVCQNDKDRLVILGLGLVSVGMKMAGQANLCL